MLSVLAVLERSERVNCLDIVMVVVVLILEGLVND